MHNKKIYFHVMQAQGGPSRAELWDKGPTGHSRFTSLTEISCSNQQSASKAKKKKKTQQKAIPMPFYSRKHFSLRK